MKTRIALILAGTLAGTSVSAFAHPGWRQHDQYRNYQRARVVQVEPVSRIVRVAIPRTRYASQTVRTRVSRRDNAGAALVGSIVGGIIGHNIGHGRSGSTVAGAIVGAAVGQSLAPDQHVYSETIAYNTHVRPRYEARRIRIGYDVTYRFHGRLYTKRTQHRPGRFIRVDDHNTHRDD